MKHALELLPKEDLTPLSIALEMWLKQFDIETIESAQPTSTLRRNLENYNRVQNILLGNDVNYNVTRVCSAWFALANRF